MNTTTTSYDHIRNIYGVNMRGTTKVSTRLGYMLATGQAKTALGDGTIILKRKTTADGILIVKTGYTTMGNIETGRINTPMIHAIRDGKIIASYTIEGTAA